MFESSFDDIARGYVQQMLKEIDALSEQRLRVPIEELVQHFVNKFEQQMPMLHPQRAEWSPVEHQIDPTRQQFIVRVPFDGESELFRYHGRSYPVMLHPSFNVSNRALQALVSVDKGKPEYEIGEVQRTIDRISNEGLMPLSG